MAQIQKCWCSMDFFAAFFQAKLASTIKALKDQLASRVANLQQGGPANLWTRSCIVERFRFTTNPCIDLGWFVVGRGWGQNDYLFASSTIYMSCTLHGHMNQSIQLRSMFKTVAWLPDNSLKMLDAQHALCIMIPTRLQDILIGLHLLVRHPHLRISS